jgi:hypoxanthine-guanine phosphoribosyltransferase
MSTTEILGRGRVAFDRSLWGVAFARLSAADRDMDLAPDERVSGRTIVMLDDVLDTGTTMAFAERVFLERGAKAVESAVLVEKENERAVYQHGADIVGFKSPAKLWLTGMGMDDAKDGVEHNRWSGKIEIVS